MKRGVYFGGVPTDIDIKKIREFYEESDLAPGRIIPYDEVAELLKINKNSFRFRTVTNRWRKIVENETNIIIGTEPGEGFKVLTESEKAELSGSKLRSAGRFARRSYVVGNRIDRRALTEDEARMLDHKIAVSAKVLAAAQLRQNLTLPQL